MLEKIGAKNLNIFQIIKNNKDALYPIALHDVVLTKYAMILSYYPMKDSKYFVPTVVHLFLGL